MDAWQESPLVFYETCKKIACLLALFMYDISFLSFRTSNIRSFLQCWVHEETQPHQKFFLVYRDFSVCSSTLETSNHLKMGNCRIHICKGKSNCDISNVKLQLTSDPVTPQIVIGILSKFGLPPAFLEHHTFSKFAVMLEGKLF